MSGLAPSDYPKLPGPARFVADVADDLRKGKTAIVVFPDAVVDSGIADAILVDLAHEWATAEFCTTSQQPLPSRIIDTFGGGLGEHRQFDEWEAIVGWQPWHGAWVFLPAWEHTDSAEIVDRWPAQVHASGLTLEDRPKLVLGVRLSDVTRSALTRVDTSVVAVHWWWGVLDRLDTETRLAAVAPRTFNAIEQAVITELASWDLAAVDHLTEEWDRTTTGAGLAISSYQQQRGAHPCDSNTGGRRNGSTPPAELEDDWRNGVIERWGHSIRHSPTVLTDKAVTQRVWMAHNRVLIPQVDEERADYERMILSIASDRALADLRRRDDELVEIGSLDWLVSSGRVDIGSEHRRRLRAFRNLRNRLAHRTPIEDSTLRQVMTYLES